MKNLKEFKASGEDSSTADPIDTGDNSLPTGKRKGEGQDPMPKIAGGGTPSSDFIDNPATKGQAPSRRGDNRNSEPMPKLKAMREVLNLMATLTAEQVEELRAELAGDDEPADDASVASLVKEDFDALFGGAELSEEAKAKAFAIFEGAVLVKISEEKARLEAEYEARIDEEIEELTSELEDRVNKYMDYVAEEWAKDNELAIEAGVRNEFSESFIEGLKVLFAEHYVAVPEGKDDIIEQLASRVEDLEARLNESVDENLRVVGIIKTKAREEALAESLDGLTDVQKEKLTTLAEGIEYGDIAEFETKVKILKENFLAEKTVVADPAAALNEEVGDENADTTIVSSQMRAYIDALAASQR